MNKHLLILLVVLTGLLVFYYILSSFSNNSVSKSIPKPKDASCYRHRYHSEPNILATNVTKSKSIFFIETSCFSEKSRKLVITSRQACAVESTARANPNLDVYLLYVSSGIVKFQGTESDRFLQAILSYDNVKIRHLDMEQYMRDTPVQNIWENKKLEASEFVYPHASDVLRLVTMWRYGGIYLDLDIISLKSLEDLPPNFIAIESTTLVANGILSFTADGNGHKFAESLLQDIQQNFDGNLWIHNGPEVTTRFGKKICDVAEVPDLFGKVCQNFTFYPPEVFLPVSWQNWKMLFDAKKVEEVHKMAEDSYTLHLWTNLNSDIKTKITDLVPHTIYGKKFCPKVFQECDEYF